MASSVSVISISNRALLSVGARAQVSSLAEGSTEANAISVLYTPTFEALARTAPWNCLRKQATLTLLAAAQGTPENPDGTSLPFPPSPWLYSYELPPDCLQVRFMMPPFTTNTPSGTAPLTSVNNLAQSWVPGASGQIQFAVAYATDTQNNPIQVILTNLSQAQAVYTVDQSNPTIWDSLFQAAMVASLAAFLVPALSLNMQLMQIQIKVAEAAIAQARIRDGNEGTTSQDRVPDWMRARTTGYLYDYGGAGTQPWGAWTGMSWPGAF